MLNFEDMGKRIKEKRLFLSMTQEELAEKLDLSVAYIGMLERGERTPSLETFVQLADELDATADELLCGVLQKGYLERMSAYEDRIARLQPKEAQVFYKVIEALLGV